MRKEKCRRRHCVDCAEVDHQYPAGQSGRGGLLFPRDRTILSWHTGPTTETAKNHLGGRPRAVDQTCAGASWLSASRLGECSEYVSWSLWYEQLQGGAGQSAVSSVFCECPGTRHFWSRRPVARHFAAPINTQFDMMSIGCYMDSERVKSEGFSSSVLVPGTTRTARRSCQISPPTVPTSSSPYYKGLLSKYGAPQDNNWLPLRLTRQRCAGFRTPRRAPRPHLSRPETGIAFSCTTC